MLEKLNKLIEFKVKDNRLDIIFKSEDYTYSMNAKEANELVGELYELVESLDEYDKEKDPRYIYQRGLRNQIYIDIKQDDGEIIKTIIKNIKRNPKLSNLIGNKNDKDLPK